MNECLLVPHHLHQGSDRLQRRRSDCSEICPPRRRHLSIIISCS